MIWWWGKQYQDKIDALAQGAYENTTVEMLPLVTCKCCGENELEKMKSMAKMYDEDAQRAFDAQQDRPRRDLSRASRHDYTMQYQEDITYERNHSSAEALKWAIRELEGRGGCL